MEEKALHLESEELAPTREINIRPFDETFLWSYQRFCKREFTADLFQKERAYLTWLQENPKIVRGLRKPATHLALDENGEVVGCVHKLYMPWLAGNEILPIPAIHNLMVATPYRNGTGAMLLLRALAGERYAVIPGVTGPLVELYRSLQCRELPGYWYRSILRPIHTALSVASFRYRGVGSAPHFIQPIQNDWSPVAGVTASAAPAAACVEQFLAASKRAFTLSTLAPNLDLESFGWRFFAPQGPRHLMLSIDGATKGWLLLTVGPRRGVNVCRIITMLSDTRAGYELLLTAARKTARTLGADILLYFHASPLLAAVLRCGGLAPIKNSPLTFLYSRKRAFPFEEIGFDGAAGDFGLEGIVPGDLR